MQPDAELLSGYLDGELTPFEKAAVEQWLTEDASARELLEDLRVLRTELQHVPRVQLPEEFASEVLRSAERLMLLGPAELTPSAQAEYDSARTELAPRTARRHLWSSPAWFITGAAVAVLLMIALGSWRRSGEQFAARQSNPPVDGRVTESSSGVAKSVPGNRVENVATASTDAESPLVGMPSTTTGNEPRSNMAETALGPMEPGRAASPIAAEPPTKIAIDGAPERERDPYGVVFSCIVDRSAIADGAFDRLLAECGISLAAPRDVAENRETISEDVVYAEATMGQLSDALGKMLLNPTVYKSTVMHMTLGLFRQPKLWSEMLDAEGAPAGDAASPGSRAVHFKPRGDQAEALVIEEATQAELMESGTSAIAPRAADGDAGTPTPPVVDNGLVRAVFILRVAP